MPKKFREVRRLLRSAGWVCVRQTGSHETWREPSSGRTVIVAGRGSQDVRPGTLASMRRATGMEELR